jgi:hypothetical protein
VLRDTDIYNLIIALFAMCIPVIFWRKKLKDEPNNKNSACVQSDDSCWDDQKWRSGSYPNWYADHSDYQREERKFWRNQIIINAATFIAAVVAGYIAYRAYTETKRQANEASRQATAAEQQVSIAHDTERQQLRAYLGASKAVIERRGDTQPNLFITLMNFGSTPAYNVLAVTFDHIIEEAAAENDEWDDVKKRKISHKFYIADPGQPNEMLIPMGATGTLPALELNLDQLKVDKSKLWHIKTCVNYETFGVAYIRVFTHYLNRHFADGESITVYPSWRGSSERIGTEKCDNNPRQ